jgi:predicted RNA polymerase sigma factor
MAALELVDALADEPSLKNYHWLPSVRGDLLAKLGRRDEARVAFERAAAMTRNACERDMLLARAGEMRNPMRGEAHKEAQAQAQEKTRKQTRKQTRRDVN